MKTSITNRLLPFFVLSLTALMIGVVAYVNQARAVPDQPEDKNDIVDAIVAHKRPQIEVVFVLDTTSSMSGMIEAAKENIWSIASTMASAQPAPEIKMGLVAFRDRGDAYVTKVFDLSEDLDGMYATLMDFKPQGGGDGPESVNQALHDAVSKISWSDNRSSYKTIFLVGDAPPIWIIKTTLNFRRVLLWQPVRVLSSTQSKPVRMRKPHALGAKSPA